MKNKGTVKKFFGSLLIIGMMILLVACAKKEQEITVDECSSTLMKMVPEPGYGAVGGEWAVLGLARWGGEVPQEWFDGYYERLENYVKECRGVLHEKKYTEYSRVILALTAIGKDPSNVGGYNLLESLADYEQTIFQGINGPVYALLALDSGNYEIPQNVVDSTQATRELYVDDILSREIPGGGWALSGGEAEIDITAMVLQALAKYQDRQDVADAVERALVVLSEQQNDKGGYAAYDTESSESVSQVITALAELNIDPEDSRFVKKGHTLKDRLMDFWAEDGGFRHLLDGDADLMATEQAFYAMVALERRTQEISSLYKMK